MANSSTLVKLTSVILVIMIMGAPNFANAALSCGQVVSSLGPCITYLKGTGGAVPKPCCNGVTSLNKAASTTPDRQTACKCLTAAAGRIQGINPSLASGLPGKCGVSLPYKISPNIDCSRVK